MKYTTKCKKCGGGTGQTKPCSCAVDNITEVAKIKPSVNEDAVRSLEEALVLAKSGEIEAVCVSWVLNDKSIGGNVSEADSDFQMFLAVTNSIEFLKQRLFTYD